MKSLITFTMDAITLSNEQLTNMSQLLAEWTIIATKNDRYLIDALIPFDNIAIAESALADYNPVIIGIWDFNGNLQSQFNSVEYIEMLPPKITLDIDGNIIETIPATEAIEIHKFGGWPDRRFV